MNVLISRAGLRSPGDLTKVLLAMTIFRWTQVASNCSMSGKRVIQPEPRDGRGEASVNAGELDGVYGGEIPSSAALSIHSDATRSAHNSHSQKARLVSNPL